MALPIKNAQLNSIADLDTFRNGGKGSGNFGHAGRPGEVGGSAPSGSSSANYYDFEDDDWPKNLSDSELQKTKKDIESEIEAIRAESKSRKSYPQDHPYDPDSEISDAFAMDDANYRLSLVKTELSDRNKGSSRVETKYSTENFDDAVDYIFADGNIAISDDDMGWMGFGYDVLGKPVRYSRFKDRADDKIWQAWASMQKIQDDPMLGDVTGEGLASANDAKRLAKSVIATSQTAYLPSERKAAQEQTKKFVKGVKDEVKKAKFKLTADTKKYGDTEVRKATRKALDDISSAMDDFLGFEKPSREYPMPARKR